MNNQPTLRKFFVPIIYLAEWFLFLFVALCIATLNMINLVNIITVDMPWEEPLIFTSSFIFSLSFVIGLAIICFFYNKFLMGSKAYQKFKKTIWGILFGLNTISCVLCGILIYGFNFFHSDGILLLIITLLSAIITKIFISKN
ncbi:hypothetical protein H9635_05890 [Solibacillus sp. A46]|uniref:Uncharacterized protein n=1 Tax=Solibacillus faecavium TaxID=2762221 RepID=A0ABR8XWE3_9BACL|nr:hypothetical protein [Solibacillus faecavium]MBD8036268.1 hypothetical protein [Solibacillus faecavium]